MQNKHIMKVHQRRDLNAGCKHDDCEQYSESTEKENKKQIDLAEGIGVSRQTMSKIMNGARAINAIELHKISEYLHVPMETLMKMPEHPVDTNVIHAFMGRVKTPEARRGIQIADELSDMILFHTKVYENGKRMEQPWEDNE